MSWVWLLLAGIFEVFFATLLKLSQGFTKPLFCVGFAAAAILSFFCLTKALQGIPIGTAYAIWTGMGASGVVIIGILYFDEPANALRLFFLATLVLSILALKWVSPDPA